LCELVLTYNNVIYSNIGARVAELPQ